MPDAVSASIHIDASPERVYEYFTRPDAMTLWMGEHARLEPEPGGRFEVSIRGAEVRGLYLELEPPRRLVVSWGYDGSELLPAGASTVEVRLIADAGGTRVELDHRDLPEPEVRGHRLGWDHYLARLELAGSGRDPGTDPGMPAP
jgi:uncharacterized protein YndB with AHSA1/START domain